MPVVVVMTVSRPLPQSLECFTTSRPKDSIREPRTYLVGSFVTSSLDQVIWYLIAGTRGGPSRARILQILRSRPYNAHALSEAVGMNYRTVRHHLNLLLNHGLLTRPAGDVYASPYFLSPALEANIAALESICAATRSVRGGAHAGHH